MIAFIESEQPHSPFKGMLLSQVDMERLLARAKIQSQECVCRTGWSGQKNRYSINSRNTHKYSTGTDGCRVLCHKFSTSSLPCLENSISRCTTCRQKMNSYKEATLLFSSADGQARNIRTTVFPLTFGRQSCSVWWSSMNRSIQWQQRMESRMKRSIASYVMSKISVDNKKRNVTLIVPPTKR